MKKNILIIAFTIVAAAAASLIAQTTGLKQIHNDPIGRSIIGLCTSFAFVFLYDMKTSKSLPGGTKQSIYSGAMKAWAFAAGICAGVIASLINF